MITSLETAAVHVHDSLRDPADPKYCARYYLYFVHSLAGVPGSAEENVAFLPIAPHSSSSFQRSPDASITRVAEDHPQTLTALMLLIRHIRSREEMTALAQKMGTCSCDMQDPYIVEAHDWHWRNHNESPGRYPAPFHPRTDTLDCLLRALGTILGLQIELFFMNSEQERTGGPGLSWPRFETDIFGPNRTGSVTQCCRWLDEYPSFQLLHLIASFARPEDQSIIATLLHSATLPRNIVQLLNFACDALPPIPPTDFGMMPYQLPTILVANLITSFSCTVDGVSTAYFYEDQAEPMLDAITRVTREIHEHCIGEDLLWTGTMGAHGGYIHEKLALPYDPVRYHPIIIRGSQYARPQLIDLRNERPFPTALNLLYANAKLMQTSCSNPDCTSSPWPGTTAGEYQQCSKCRRVVYCSQSCQMHEWKHALKPHKNVCEKLKHLGELAGFPAVARGGAEPPRMSDTAFRSACTSKAGLGSQAVVAMNRVLMQDNRIMKILHHDYSLHYEYRLS